jgi:hypothetical protein
MTNPLSHSKGAIFIALLLGGCATQPNSATAGSIQPPSGCPTGVTAIRAEACSIRDKAMNGSEQHMKRFGDLAAELAELSGKYPDCPVRFFMDPCF